MMKGNSGSTLFNAAGKGVAIFSHIYVGDKTLTQSDSGLGTKYACTSPTETLGPQTRGSNSCVTISNKDIEILVQNSETKSHNEVVDQIQKIEIKIINLFTIESDQEDMDIDLKNVDRRLCVESYSQTKHL